jgi:KDO2-lipid IV(A) lauroyltransferase
MRPDIAAAPGWHARGLNNRLIFGATYYGVTHLPLPVSYGLGHVGTWLAYRLMRDGTDGLVSNFRVVCPGESDRSLHRLALDTYRSYARDVIDFIRGIDMDRAALAKKIYEFDDTRFSGVLAEGRGVIVAGGHFGNWELGGVALRVLRDVPLTVVGRPEASAFVGALRQRMRESLNIETIEIGQALDTALRIRKILDSNGAVAMLIDRHLGRDRVDVEFFGRRSGFLRSPAMIAALTGAPILPSFMIRREDGRFSAVCGETIRVDPSLPVEDGVRNATQEFAAQLESRIREHPQLWYQFYPYWTA